jgi:hypothetical protein
MQKRGTTTGRRYCGISAPKKPKVRNWKNSKKLLLNRPRSFKDYRAICMYGDKLKAERDNGNGT